MKYSDNDNYPEVYLPSYIEKIYTLEEVIVDTPPNPPDPPSKEVTPKFNFNLIVVILVFSMLIVGLTSLITTNDIILIVSVVLSIAYFISQCRKEISEHRNRIISIEERYKEALLSHPLALKEYDEDLERWKIWLEKTSKNYKEEAEKSRRGEL